jgi:DNA-binding NarL/FixJ family response regulator
MNLRVVLGDAHRSFVEALALRLDAEDGFEVAATVVRPEEALRVVRSQPVDVAVLAVGSGADGFVNVGRQLTALQAHLKLVAVAADDDIDLLARAVGEGFSGWVPKDVGIGSLLGVLHAVCQGETCIPPMLLSRLMPQLVRDLQIHRAAAPPLGGLTTRELQVLKAMVGGASRNEIADQLAISSNTVRTHMQSILNKLGVHSSLAAVAAARRAGIS